MEVAGRGDKTRGEKTRSGNREAAGEFVAQDMPVSSC